MKRLMLEAGYGPKRQFLPIRRGLLGGCELYLSRQERLPMEVGIFEREIGERFSRMAEYARVFVDVGAAEGFFSIYMLRNTNARIFAFEAADDFADLLTRNVERNSAGDRNARISCSDSPLVGSRGGESVDSVVGDCEGPIFLKIDAEGDEVEILEGAGTILTGADSVVMVKVRDRPTEDRCLRMLNACGFAVEIIGPAWWRRALGRERTAGGICRWLVAEKSRAGGLVF